MWVRYQKYNGSMFFQDDEVMDEVAGSLKAYAVFVLFHSLRSTGNDNIVHRTKLLRDIGNMDYRTWMDKWQELYKNDVIRPLDKFRYMLNPQAAWTHGVDKAMLVRQWHKLPKHKEAS